MKTNPNDTINPQLIEERTSDYVDMPNTMIYSTGGLTKREHMAIEFTKAYASSNYIANSGVPHERIAQWGIEMADELIKQLNNEN